MLVKDVYNKDGKEIFVLWDKDTFILLDCSTLITEFTGPGDNILYAHEALTKYIKATFLRTEYIDEKGEEDVHNE